MAQQYVTMGVAGEIVAARVEAVQEILDMVALARLPHTPENLLGMIDLRGASVPVLDLRLMLGLGSIPDSEHTRIVVMSANETTGMFGLRADSVIEVTVLDQDELQPAPELSGWRSTCIEGLGRKGERFVTVVDFAGLVDGADVVGDARS